MFPEVRVIGITGIPEIKPGSRLALIIAEAAQRQGTPLETGDVLVVAQKVVSKAEGRLVELAKVTPSPFAQTLAAQSGKDPRLVEVILGEAQRVVRMERGVLIVETHHGFVAANAGMDESNVAGGGVVTLLPKDPDRSAQELRREIEELAGVSVGVIISDSFGRPWREGQVNVALGVAGLKPFADYRGQKDPWGYIMKATLIAAADELAAAAELVMGKTAKVPAAIIRGYRYPKGEGSGQQLLRPKELDLFR